MSAASDRRGAAGEEPVLAKPARSARGPAAIVAVLSRYRFVIAAFLASRLALLAVGLMTQIFIEPFSTHVSTLHLSGNAALRIWGQWDTGWYHSIATAGYWSHAGPDGQANWAFFPAFPLLSAGLARLAHMPVFVAMVVISNLSFLAALMFAHRLARAEFDDRTADIAVTLICVAPGSYIYSSAYTESLFLFALAGCLLSLRAERWLAAGSFVALAVLTRSVGICLALPLAMAAAPKLWAIVRELGAPGAGQRLTREALRVGVGLALPVFALAAFGLLLYRACGDPLAFMTAQKAWGREVGIPLVKPLMGLFRRGEIADGDLISFVACWLSLGMLAALAFMRRWSLLALAGALVFVPLSTGLTSYARYCLVNLPLFMAGAKLLASRPTAAMATLVGFSTINGFLAVAWMLAMWVTV